MTNLATKFGLGFWKFICSTLIWILLSFTAVPFFLVLFTIRFLSSKFAVFIDPSIYKIVSPEDALYVSHGDDRNFRMMTCYFLEGIVTLEDLCSTFESRVILKKNDKENLQWPKLQQYIVHKLDFPFWKWDQSFDIRNHIHMLPIDPKSHKTETGVDLQKILDVLEDSVLHKPFAARQSPWEVLLVQNVQDTPKYGKKMDEGPSTMLIFHFDHVIGNCLVYLF